MKLNLKIIIISFLFYNNTIFSQNGYAYYSKQLSESSEETTNNYIKQALEKLKEQKYKLSFNSKGAVFEKMKALSSDNNTIVEAFIKSFSGFSGKTYLLRENDYILQKLEFSGKDYVIIKSRKNWTLTKNTMYIDNHLCYKATAKRTIKNSTGIHDIQITAWYSPEINLPYGPDGYGGLPGLILQLEDNKTITILNKIEFFKDKAIKIDFEPNGEKITEKDFNALVYRAYENRKN